MYEVIPFHQAEIWQEKLKQIRKKDLFHNPFYSRLYLNSGDGEPHLFFYYDNSGNKLCYTFMKRKINNLPLFYGLEKDLFDIITPPYGYGGPLTDTEDREIIKEFRKEFIEYCSMNDIISEFVRFNPLLQNQKYMVDTMELVYDRETIYVDLTKSEKLIMDGYHKNHQRNIKKAKKNLLQFRVLQRREAMETAPEFYQMYKETMLKLKASEYSFFSLEYITELLGSFPNQSMIGAIFHEGQMINAVLCLHEGDTLHYHLGCSKKEFLSLGGSIFALHQTALWAKKEGLRTFHLGGGHIGRDSLFQFKHRFNQDGMLDFFIGRNIIDHEQYRKLMEHWKTSHPQSIISGSFFPTYRSGPTVHGK